MSVPADTPDVLALEARIAALEVRMASLEAENVRLADDLSTCRAINVLDAEIADVERHVDRVERSIRMGARRSAARFRLSDDGIGGGE